MGGQNSVLYSQENFPKQFRQLREVPGVYRSIVDGSRLQRHIIEIQDNQDIKYQKEIFMFRKVNAERVITARYFQRIEPVQFCGSFNKICFFTQMPQSNFSNNLKIPLDHGINLIIQCLEGFQILYKKFGGFEVCENQIFIDCKGKIKVWVSGNLGKTRPNSSCSKQKVVQQYMIGEIFKIFDHSQEDKKISCQYTSYLRKFQANQRQLLSFQRIINYMGDIRCKYFTARTKKNQNVFQESFIHQKKFKLKKLSDHPPTQERRKLTRRSQDDEPTFRKNQNQSKVGLLASTQNQSVRNTHFLKNQTRIAQNQSTFRSRDQNIPLIHASKRMIRRSADDHYYENIPLVRDNRQKYKISSNYFDPQQNQKLSSTKFNSGATNINKANQKRISITNNKQIISDLYTNFHTNNDNHFLRQMKTAQSIIQHTDLNIDSTILVDLQNFEKQIERMDQGSSYA